MQLYAGLSSHFCRDASHNQIAEKLRNQIAEKLRTEFFRHYRASRGQGARPPRRSDRRGLGQLRSIVLPIVCGVFASAALIDTASSGLDVANAARVVPTIAGDTRAQRASPMVPRTNSSPPNPAQTMPRASAAR